MKPSKPHSCVICGVQGPGALVPVDLCRDHLSMFQGRLPLENHHPEGRANSPETVRLPVSIHFPLTALQTHWPDALRYPSKDPVIQIARRLQVTQDFIKYLRRASRRDVNFLIAVSLAQQENRGPDWWKLGGVAPLIQEVPDEP
jgi:hypothetical protein